MVGRLYLAEAVEQAGALQPDVVLLDLVMPVPGRSYRRHPVGQPEKHGTLHLAHKTGHQNPLIFWALLTQTIKHHVSIYHPLPIN